MITNRLADFAADRSAADIPEAALGAAVNALIDTLGVALAGVTEPVADIAAGWIADLAAKPQATVWGRLLATHPAEAAFANGISSHALDFDDSHPSARGHMSASLVPVAIAVGEGLNASGRDVLAAYVIGLEIASAIGRAFGPAHLQRGWHPTATVGVFGTTTVAAKLYGLDAAGFARAWAIAGSQVSGLGRNFGTMAKPFHAGHAARTGIVSAWLARQGLTADEGIFDGKRGVLDLYSGGDGDPVEEILAGLGKRWEVLHPGNYVKRWPCCYSNHRALGSLYRLIEEKAIKPDDVTEVAVSFLPGGDTALVSRDPHTGLEGKFSIEYVVAAALLDGPLGMASFTDEMVGRSAIRDLMKRVRRVAIPDSKTYSGIGGYNEIAVTTRNDRFTVREHRVPGSPEWPMSDTDRDAKFTDCAQPLLGAKATQELLANAKNCLLLAGIRTLAEATIPASPR